MLRTKSTLLNSCAIAFFSVCLVANYAQSQNAQTSVWNSSEGRMTLNYDGQKFWGKYENDNGRISGTQNGTKFDGYWGEDSSGTKCSYARLDTYYWGQVHWQFSGNTFSGQYSFCDNANSGSWSGTLAQGNPIQNAPVYTPPVAVGKSIDSIWSSSEGRLRLNVGATQFNGNYDNDNGRVSGSRNGNVLDGFWGEDTSGKRCEYARLGTNYWGKLHWVFNGKAFTGQYSYCDDAYSGSWSGTLESGNLFAGINPPPKPPIVKPPIVKPPVIAPVAIQSSVWNTSEGVLTLKIQGNGVSGTYVNDNGRISGTKSGNTITGFWGEDSSGTKCTTKKLNTYYWGKIKWVFNGNSFSGQYSYCEGAMSGSWTGTKR